MGPSESGGVTCKHKQYNKWCTAKVIQYVTRLHGECVAGLLLDLQLLLNLTQLLRDLQLVCKGCLPAAPVHNLIHTYMNNGLGVADTAAQIACKAGCPVACGLKSCDS